MSQRSEKLYAVILRVLLFFGLAVAAHGIFYCYQVNMTESWPRVEGVILESYLDKSTSDGSSRYKAKIHYSYEINGSMYERSNPILMKIISLIVPLFPNSHMNFGTIASS